MAKIKSPIVIGDYKAVLWRRCISSTEMETGWFVYRIGVFDRISDHATLASAKAAIARYQHADLRHGSPGA